MEHVFQPGRSRHIRARELWRPHSLSVAVLLRAVQKTDSAPVRADWESAASVNITVYIA
mgnify:CR=1 FL=1